MKEKSSLKHVKNIIVVFPAAVSWVLLLHTGAGLSLAAAFCVVSCIILGVSYKIVQTFKERAATSKRE